MTKGIQEKKDMSLEEMTKAIEGGCFVFDRTHPAGWDFAERYGRPVGYGYGDRFAVPLLYGDASEGKEGRLFILTGRAARSERDPEIYRVEDTAILEFPSLRPCPDIRDIIFPPDRDKEWQSLWLGGVRRIDSPGPDVASEMGKHMERAVSQPSGHDMQEKKSSLAEDFTELYAVLFFDNDYPLDPNDPVTWEERDEALDRMKRDTTPLDVLGIFADWGTDLSGALKARPGLQAYAGSLRLRALEDVRDGMAQRHGDNVELCKGNRLYRLEENEPSYPDYPNRLGYSLSYDTVGVSGGNRIRTKISGPADFFAEEIGKAHLFAVDSALDNPDGIGKADILAEGKGLDHLYGIFRNTIEKLMDTPFPDLPEDVYIRIRTEDRATGITVSKSGILMYRNGRTVSETKTRKGRPSLTAAGARREFERLLSAGKTKPSHASDRQPSAMER